MKEYKSHARWPPGVVHGDMTTDMHDTAKEARAVCNMLERDGFGGDGEVFPVATWISHEKVEPL